MGCHVEMTQLPGRDFPLGATYQPGERPLELSVTRLTAVGEATAAVAGQRGVHRFDDFVIYNEPRARDQLRLLARGLANQGRQDPLTSEPRPSSASIAAVC